MKNTFLVAFRGLVLAAAFVLGVLPACAASADLAKTSRAAFEIVDGKTKVSVLEISADASKTADDLEVSSELKPFANPDRLVWITQIRNRGTERRWLTLRWSTQQNISEQSQYWSGRGEPSQGEMLAHLSPTDARDTLSLQAIYDGNNGLALALNPTEIVSDYYQKFRLVDKTHGQMTLEIPLVLDAGQSENFSLDLFSFAPRYGFRDAVQKYYDAHPAAFSPRENIDQRALGAGALYTIWNTNEPELARRFGASWDWVYAPFKRAGDIYGREELWDYKTAFPVTDEMNILPQPEFQKARRARLQRGKFADVAMMFYVPSFIWSEQQLAEKKFPGAILKKSDGSLMGYAEKWVTFHDREVLVYPWGNELAVQSQRDLQQLLDDDLNIQGFAYDVLGGGLRHRGSGMEQSPRRAFDANGEYVDISVGIAKMMDFSRGLEKNGRNMALVANPSGGAGRMCLTTRTDANICEFLPFKHIEWLRSIRLMSGHKPLSWWDVWGLSDSLNWQEMSAEDLHKAFLAARDYLLLESFANGVMPTPRLVMGVPRLARLMPQLRRIARAGWQPVSAVSVSDASGHRSTPIGDSTLGAGSTLWAARYGKGVGSFITLGNASDKPFYGWIDIDNTYIGDANYLFARENKQTLVQETLGRTTRIKISLAAREPLVLQAVATIAPKITGEQIVYWTDDGARGTLVLGVSGKPQEVVAPPESCTMPRQSSRLGGDGSWNFQSTIFAMPRAQLREFPFVGKGDTTAKIVLPENAAPEAEWAARRVQEYFRFWGRSALSPPKTLELPIVREAPAPGTPAIFIGTPLKGEELPVRWGPSKNQLILSAHDAEQMHVALIALLDALDEKYPYIGQFQADGFGKDAPEVLKKAGFFNGVLD